MRIGYKIRKVRELRNYTQEYIASRLRISTCNYSKLERDEISLTLNRLQEISNILDYNIIDILTFDESQIFCLPEKNNNNNDNHCFSEKTSAQLEEVIIRLNKIEEILNIPQGVKQDKIQ